MIKARHLSTALGCAILLLMAVGCGKDAAEATVASICDHADEAYAAQDDKFDRDKCEKAVTFVKEKASAEDFKTLAECVYAASVKDEVVVCARKGHEAALKGNSDAGSGGATSKVSVKEQYLAQVDKLCACMKDPATSKGCMEPVKKAIKQIEKDNRDMPKEEQKEIEKAAKAKMADCMKAAMGGPSKAKK